MKYYCCGITDKGIRPHNEDAVLIHKRLFTSGSTETTLSTPFMIAVSDGVAGEKSGEIAASMCLKMLKQMRFSQKTDLTKKVFDIHNRVKKYSCKHSQSHNMQTTLCALGIDENNMLYCVNVGDSRLYMFRNTNIRQLSKDHSLVQLLYEQGKINFNEIRKHSHKHFILPAIGNITENPSLDIKKLNTTMEFGDVFLLCTDGLSDYVSNYEIEEILALPTHLLNRLSILVNLAISNGGSDNISIVAISRIP